jgi:trans-2,3-dihydro-3-hydroxyanthranilate isomerase
MRRRFHTLDVFTRSRFAGNPLAVVLDAEGLDTATMQSIAKEFNLSETVFVLPPADPAHRATLRIFTPMREMPFAGHPTVGTAVLLGLRDGGTTKDFVLGEGVGPVPCRFVAGGENLGRATFDLPQLPAPEGQAGDRAAVATALGLTAGDIGLAPFDLSGWSAGNAFTMVPVSGLDAMRRCLPAMAKWDAFSGVGKGNAFLFCTETAEPGNDFHARMFGARLGIHEDPATGSAVAAFAGLLAAQGGYGDGDHMLRIEQGYEMGRPSLIELGLTIRNGTLTAATIAGDAIVVSEGTIEA